MQTGKLKGVSVHSITLPGLLQVNSKLGAWKSQGDTFRAGNSDQGVPAHDTGSIKYCLRDYKKWTGKNNSNLTVPSSLPIPSYSANGVLWEQGRTLPLSNTQREPNVIKPKPEYE